MVIDTMLFDVDGTLLDTFEFIYRAFDHAFRLSELPSIDRHSISALMGKPLEDCYRELAPRHDPHEMAILHRDFQAANIDLARPFPSTINVLSDLQRKGVAMAAVTTRSRRTSLRTLENNGLLGFFDIVISAEDVSHHKPHPEPLLKAINVIGAQSGRALMVGDTEADVNAGRAAGVLTAGVTYGFSGERIRQVSPDFVLDDLAELLTLGLTFSPNGRSASTV